MRIGKGKNTKPHALRKSGKKALKKSVRKAEALARQQKFDALAPEEKQKRNTGKKSGHYVTSA